MAQPQQGYPPPQQGYPQQGYPQQGFPPPQQTTVIVQGKAYNTSTNLPPKVLATLAVVFQWLGSIIIIFVEYQNAFAIAWAYQSLFSAIMFWIVWIVFQIIASSCFSSCFDYYYYTTGGNNCGCYDTVSVLVYVVWIIYLVYIISLLILIWTRGDREEFFAMPGIGRFAWNRAVRRVTAYGLPVTGSCSTGCGSMGVGAAGGKMAPGTAVVAPVSGSTVNYTNQTPV